MDFRNISAWSIRNPVPSIVLFLMLTVAGIVSFARMDINEQPDIDFPIVSIDINHQPASATVALPQTQVIEGKLAEITDLARTYLGQDPVKDLVMVQPTAHYAMGGIPTDLNGLCLSDGNGGTAEQAVTVTVSSAADAPTLSGPTSATVSATGLTEVASESRYE